MADQRAEVVAQIRRSLALLRGCDSPGMRAQIEHLIGDLRARLQQMTIEPDQQNAMSLVPSGETACRFSPQECRSYAIQCESLASMAIRREHKEWLVALARLWRAMAAQ